MLFQSGLGAAHLVAFRKGLTLLFLLKSSGRQDDPTKINQIRQANWGVGPSSKASKYLTI